MVIIIEALSYRDKLRTLVTEDLMKRVIGILVVVVLLITGCSSPTEEGITLTKENYDLLMTYKIDNDRLISEVEYLEKRLEDMTGKSLTTNTSTTEVEETTPETPEEDTVALEDALEEPEVLEEGYTEDEISGMVLSLYKDDYGIYGYKNGSGEVIIEADFDTATEMINGLASVTSGGKSGTISGSGIINWDQIETYTATKVTPRNDVTEDSSFGQFLTEYRKALEDMDEAYIKSHTHPNVKISFGGHSGWDGLVDYWSLDDGSDAFYKMMATTLKYGAVDTSGGQGNAFMAPYVFTDFPATFDAFTYSVVIGSGVNIRTRPTTSAEIVTTSSYEVLKVLEEEKDGWVKVQLPDGSRAYIYGTYLWSPIGYRAEFTKVDNAWLLEFFVKGD